MFQVQTGSKKGSYKTKHTFQNFDEAMEAFKRVLLNAEMQEKKRLRDTVAGKTLALELPRKQA